MNTNLPDFLIIPSQIIEDKNLQPLDGHVYGVIYWYTQMKLEKCTASNKTIADHLHSHPISISKSISRLATGGYIRIIIDKENGNYREIFSNITYKSNGLPPISQTANSYKSNGLPKLEHIIRKEDTKVSSTENGVNHSLTSVPPETSDNLSAVSSKDIGVLIDLFKPINPDYRKLFAIPAERKAITRLAEKYGVAKMEIMLRKLPDIVFQKYAPVITTPYQLEKKFAELVMFAKREKGGGHGRSNITVIRPDPSWNTG